MMLFIYSMSISWSVVVVVVVHFAIVLNIVVSYGVIPHLRDILYVESSCRCYFSFQGQWHTLNKLLPKVVISDRAMTS